MEFGDPGRGGPVTLLHFTPLQTDDFAPPSYAARCVETSSSNNHHLGLPPNTTAAVAPPPQMNAMSCALPYSYEVYNSLAAMEQTQPPPPPPSYCAGQQQERMQAPQPVPALPTMAQEYGDVEFNVLLHSNSSVDMTDDNMSAIGPPPVRLPRLDPSIPISIDTKDAHSNSSYPCSSLSPGSRSSTNFYGGEPHHCHSSPHSPMNGTERKTFTINKTYPKTRTKSSRRLLRATSPIFPDQSTPFSSLKRQSSTSSITSNRSMDQLTTISSVSFPQSTNSDPSVYYESSLNSPSMGAATGQISPCGGGVGGEFSGMLTASSSYSSNVGRSSGTNSRCCLELEIPAKYARKISDLDKRILKLQADRSKVLEKVHQMKSASSGLVADTRCSDMDSWLFSEKLPEMGKAYLYIIPLGIHELDDPLYDDASKLLREIGGMYLDLQTTINILRGICCKGTFIPAEISTCFAYIKSLLHENRHLKLSNAEGVYSIHLDAVEEEEVVVEEDSASPSCEGGLPMEFTEALSAANKVLGCAQHISLSYVSVQMELQRLRQIAVGKLDSCNAICQNLELLDRERRGYIRAVLEGNCTTMASAERVWPQYYQTAKQTIKIVTECIHPSPQPS